jgi:Protein of unknown function (DUF4058)
MDPFLEVNSRWQSLHAWFMRKLAERALPKAQELGCWIDVERTVYQREPSGELVLIGEPDQTLGADVSNPLWYEVPAESGAVALAEPRAIHEVVLDPASLERIKQDYLVVREIGQLPRVLAVVELLSPANKNGSYVPRYREKRMRFLASRAHFMEIDLLRGGDNPSRQLFPELPDTPYFIFVARKTAAGRKEAGYPLRLQDPLPVVGLPVGPGRPDLPLDLAGAFAAAYDLSIRPGSVAYATETPPEPPLSDADAAWVREVINAAK